MANDIGPCPGDGLVVLNAKGIVLDLNGHTVTGAIGSPEKVGVRVAMSQGVTVTNGTVRQFDACVAVFGGGGNTLSALNVHDNINHDVLTGATDECNFGDGIVMFNSKDNRVQGNTVRHNGPFSGIALVEDSDRNHVFDNDVVDNNVPNIGPNGDTAPYGAPFSRPHQDIGIRIEGPGADANNVDRNTVRNNELNGIAIHGFVCAPPDGSPPQPDNTGNFVQGNIVLGNGFGDTIDPQDGIAVLEQGPSGVVCVASGNSILANESDANARHGIFVGGRGSSGNVIDGNIVRSNGQDGIHLTGPLEPGAPDGTVDNTLRNNMGSANVLFDGWDGNPACDNNQWQGNTFVKVNQPCVGGGVPLP